VDPRAAALIRRRDEFGLAVAGDVAGREEDAALERIEWEGREQRGAIGSAENRDLGGDAGAGADGEVVDAVAVEIRGDGADAAKERPERRQRLDQVAARPEHADRGNPAGARADRERRFGKQYRRHA